MPTDNISPTETPEEFAAQWGCDPQYDTLPNERGDGYLFYNFGVEGNDPTFLEKFIPAIERTIESHRFALRDRKPNAVRQEQMEDEIDELIDFLHLVKARLYKLQHIVMETCEFVSASVIFHELPHAWEAVMDHSDDLTFGENNRSLVTGDVLFNLLDVLDYEEREWNNQVFQAAARLQAIGLQTYVDLEN